MASRVQGKLMASGPPITALHLGKQGSLNKHTQTLCSHGASSHYADLNFTLGAIKAIAETTEANHADLGSAGVGMEQQGPLPAPPLHL